MSKDEEATTSTAIANIEFFDGGDFSLTKHVTYILGHSETFNHAGTYKFIDSSHLKLDYGAEKEIYELISVSDKELRLKEGDSVKVWTTGFAAFPAQ